MIKIAFFNNWGEPLNDLLDRYSKQTPGNLGIWKNLQGTSEINKADIFVVLEGKPEGVTLDKKRTIFVKREPNYIKPEFPLEYKNIIHWEKAHCGVTWWLSSSYDELKSMKYPNKVSLASCVASTKHKHRNNFIKSLYKKRWWAPWKKVINMDLYGRGHNSKVFGERYKGPIETDGNCKLQGLLSYKYSLVLENSQQKNYWTEKLADAYLAWCIPLYWGCPNLGDFFDEKSYFQVDLDTNAKELNDIIRRPIGRGMIENLAAAREKILDEFNIWEVIWKKIEAGIL